MNLLIEHTFWGFIKDSFAVYFKNFASLFLLYSIPIFPLATWRNHVSIVEEPVQMLISSLLILLVMLFLPAFMTVAVSDICLGNKPSLKRSYLAVFGPVLGKYVWTYFLVFLLNVISVFFGWIAGSITDFIIGLIICLIIMLFLFFFYMFTLIIVILEGSSGKEALARSKDLGEGYYLRNLLVILVLGLLLVPIEMLLEVSLVGVSLVLFTEQPLVFAAIFSTFQLLVMPIQSIVLIILYYDLRVRKEAYDSTSLTRDLQRWSRQQKRGITP